jgi:hypothetical protein
VFNFLKDNPAYSIRAEDYPAKQLFVALANLRMLNKCFLYVMQDMHKWQDLQNLEFTSADPDFVQEMVKRVYPALPATATDAGVQGLVAGDSCLRFSNASSRPVLQGQQYQDSRAKQASVMTSTQQSLRCSTTPATCS